MPTTISVPKLFIQAYCEESGIGYRTEKDLEFIFSQRKGTLIVMWNKYLRFRRENSVPDEANQMYVWTSRNLGKTRKIYNSYRVFVFGELNAE